MASRSVSWQHLEHLFFVDFDPLEFEGENFLARKRYAIMLFNFFIVYDLMQISLTRFLYRQCVSPIQVIALILNRRRTPFRRLGRRLAFSLKSRGLVCRFSYFTPGRTSRRILLALALITAFFWRV